MANSTVLTGAYAIFQYSSALNKTQIDQLKAGKVPTSSSAGSWKRLFTSADDGLTLNRESESIDLKTQEEGLRASVISGSDIWTMVIPMANIEVGTYRDLLQLNPSYYGTTSAVVVPLEGDYQGVDMLENGKPVLVYHKAYHKSSQGRDVPTLGTGSDPNAWVFTKGGLSDRNMEVSYDPNTQQIQNVTFKFIGQDGTLNTNVLGAFGALTKST